jgi:CspA family cold shock protein
MLTKQAVGSIAACNHPISPPYDMHRRAQGGREPLRVTAKTIAPTTSTTTFPEQFEDAGRLLGRTDRYVKLSTGKDIPMARVNGTVKFFNHSRGFGFISPEGGDKDVFVHASALERSGVPALNEGDKVSFEIEDDKRGRGKQAANVQLA